MQGVTVIQNGSLDHCSDCGERFEIAAVRLSVFRKAAMLFVCPGCGLVRVEDHLTKARMRTYIVQLSQKLSILTRGMTRLSTPMLATPVEIELRPTQEQRHK